MVAEIYHLLANHCRLTVGQPFRFTQRYLYYSLQLLPCYPIFPSCYPHFHTVR
uniref:Uncharacterized protein n=1 Tax=Helianthus annuus TaxID=4232 RepID=A0A251V481_HELAN